MNANSIYLVQNGERSGQCPLDIFKGSVFRVCPDLSFCEWGLCLIFKIRMLLQADDFTVWSERDNIDKVNSNRTLLNPLR